MRPCCLRLGNITYGDHIALVLALRATALHLKETKAHTSKASWCWGSLYPPESLSCLHQSSLITYLEHLMLRDCIFKTKATITQVLENPMYTTFSKRQEGSHSQVGPKLK